MRCSSPQMTRRYLARGGISMFISSSTAWHRALAWMQEQMPQTRSTTWIIWW